MYVYVENNPLTYQDPSGFCIPVSSGCMYQDENPNLLIYQTELRKNPEDMQYNDKSKEQLKDILGWHWKYFDKHFGEKDLRINVEDLFKTTSIGDWDMQDIALDMFDHFMSGTGTPYRNNTLRNKVRNKGSVKEYVSDIKETVKKLLKKYNGDTSKLKYDAANRKNSLMVLEMKDTINQLLLKVT